MNEQSGQDLSVRVKLLEGEVRNLRRLAAVAILGALAIGAAAAPGASPKTIEAQEFVLKDESGSVRARLGVSREYRTVPRPPVRSPSAPVDPLDLVDRLKGAPAQPKQIEVSTTCLTFLASSGSPGAMQCTSWEDPAWSSLSFRIGKETQLSVSAQAEGATLALGRQRTSRASEAHGRLAMGAYSKGAWLKIEGPPDRLIELDLDEGITITDEHGMPRVKIPDRPRR